MLVVGSSLARAFGIVGAAGLVRYRAKIDDPKDAGVMLSTLAVGLASGVGLWLLAAFATVVHPRDAVDRRVVRAEGDELFTLKVKAKDPAALKPKLEALLARHRFEFELRGVSQEELCYEVRMPIDAKTDRLSNAILSSIPRTSPGSSGRRRRRSKKTDDGLSVVAELQGDAEVVLAQRRASLPAGRPSTAS